MNTSQIVNTILDRTNSMTTDDLTQINAAIKERWNSLQYQTAKLFKVNDRVMFYSAKKQMHVRGTVQKINAKTVQVKAENGMNWKVAPSLLEAVK